MPLASTASPLEALWVVVVLFGLLAHLVALALVIGDWEVLRRSGLNGARRVVARGAVVHGIGRLFVSLAFLSAGWIALLTPPRPASADVRYAMVALGLLVGSLALTAVALYDLREREILRAALAQRRAAIDPSLDGIVAMDERGQIIDFNIGAERLWGWTSAEVVGKDVAMLMPERFRAAHSAGVARYLKTGQGSALGKPLRLALQRRNGSQQLISITITAADGPDGIHFVAIVREAD